MNGNSTIMLEQMMNEEALAELFNPETMQQMAAVIGLVVGFVFILVLATIILLNRRDMSGWNLPISYVWFKIAGRINRKTYWLSGIVSIMLVQAIYEFIIGATMFGVSSLVPVAGEIIGIISLTTGFPLLIFGLWTAIAINVKRCHDRNRSGWFLLIGLIPLIGSIWLLIDLGFLKGTQGLNRFGPEQSDTANADGGTRKTISAPALDIEGPPSNNLNDAPRRDMISARLGQDFLGPAETDPEPVET